MHIPGLTEALIEKNTAEGSLERGREYFRDGAVKHIEDSAQTITARVKGNYYIPYAVHVSYNGQGITDVDCTCPYHKGSWCKHIAATLFAVLQKSGGESGAAAGMHERLRTLSQDELIALIEQLTADDPEPMRRIERALKSVDA